MKITDPALLAKKNIRTLKHYEAKDLPCKVKLDANESPYSLALKGLSFDTLNRYPDPEARALKKILAKELKVIPEEILLGNGSDEIISYLISTFGGPVLYPTPTFSMYGIISQSLDVRHGGIPLNKEFDLDLERMLTAIKKNKPKLVFLSTPNNPTGNCFSTEAILRIVEATQGIVVVDEAYQPFSSKTGFLPLLKDYKNMAILRTLSKIGLAGIRLGYLAADEGIIAEVNKVRLPYNINTLSQAVACEAMKNKKQLDKHIKAIISERERLFSGLEETKGVKPFPSEANFILFRVKDAEGVHKKLIRKGVLVRNLSGVIKDSLRVTIGTPDENSLFLEALRKVLGQEAQ
ncbi:MAG: histidinol-phosphate transaminase [Nitrospirales bacterium]|nr:histidinol-phosphate transaminase [Nitrospirales bacterium]